MLSYNKFIKLGNYFRGSQLFDFIFWWIFINAFFNCLTVFSRSLYFFFFFIYLGSQLYRLGLVYSILILGQGWRCAAPLLYPRDNKTHIKLGQLALCAKLFLRRHNVWIYQNSIVNRQCLFKHAWTANEHSALPIIKAPSREVIQTESSRLRKGTPANATVKLFCWY